MAFKILCNPNHSVKAAEPCRGQCRMNLPLERCPWAKGADQALSSRCEQHFQPLPCKCGALPSPVSPCFPLAQNWGTTSNNNPSVMHRFPGTDLHPRAALGAAGFEQHSDGFWGWWHGCGQAGHHCPCHTAVGMKECHSKAFGYPSCLSV